MTTRYGKAGKAAGDFAWEALQVGNLHMKDSLSISDDLVAYLIEKRRSAITRTDKNSKTAEEIEELLRSHSVLVEDTPEGTKWRRI